MTHGYIVLLCYTWTHITKYMSDMFVAIYVQL